MPISLLERQPPRIQDFVIPETHKGRLTLQNIFDPKRDISEATWDGVLGDKPFVIAGFQGMGSLLSIINNTLILDPERIKKMHINTNDEQYIISHIKALDNKRVQQIDPTAFRSSVVPSFLSDLSIVKVAFPKTFKKIKLREKRIKQIKEGLDFSGNNMVKIALLQSLTILRNELDIDLSDIREQVVNDLSLLELTKLVKNDLVRISSSPAEFNSDSFFTTTQYLARMKLIMPEQLGSIELNQTFLEYIKKLLQDRVYGSDWLYLNFAAAIRILQADRAIVDENGYRLTFSKEPTEQIVEPLPVLRSF